MLKGVLNFFIILVSVTVNFSSDLIAQRQIKKNPHVKYLVNQSNGVYVVEYTFLNPFDDLEVFSTRMPVDETTSMISVFGIPASMFDPFPNTAQVKAIREEQLREGMFLLRSNTIEVDKNAVVAFYRETFCRPVAQFIAGSLASYGRDNRENRIAFAMNFVQDIPYGIPRYSNRTRHFGGVFPPPKILTEGYGDCDSKAILFAGILSYLIDPSDFIFLNQTDHVLSAIRGDPEKGMSFVRFAGNTYLVAETAGPGRRKLGEKGKYFQGRHHIERLVIESQEQIPFSKNQKIPENIMTSDSGEMNVTLSNIASRTLRVQVLTDNSRWRQVEILPQQKLNINIEHSGTIFLKYREDGINMRSVSILPGQIYSFNYDQRRKKWYINANK